MCPVWGATAVRCLLIVLFGFYEAGVKITDDEMEQINLRTHRTNPEWNYTISPRGHTAQM